MVNGFGKKKKKKCCGFSFIKYERLKFGEILARIIEVEAKYLLSRAT